jgi:hypothetical protein
MDEVMFEDHLDEGVGAEVHEHVLHLLVHLLPHEGRDGLALVEGLGRGREGRVRQTKQSRGRRDLNEGVLVDIARDRLREDDVRRVREVPSELEQMLGLETEIILSRHVLGTEDQRRVAGGRTLANSSTMSPMERYSMEGMSSRKRAKNLMMSMSTAMSFFT